MERASLASVRARARTFERASDKINLRYRWILMEYLVCNGGGLVFCSVVDVGGGERELWTSCTLTHTHTHTHNAHATWPTKKKKNSNNSLQQQKITIHALLYRLTFTIYYTTHTFFPTLHHCSTSFLFFSFFFFFFFLFTASFPALVPRVGFLVHRHHRRKKRKKKETRTCNKACCKRTYTLLYFDTALFTALRHTLPLSLLRSHFYRLLISIILILTRARTIPPPNPLLA